MNEILMDSAMFGVVITIAGYFLGVYLKKKFKIAVLNPLLVAVVFVMVFLIIFKIDYETYNFSAKYISYLLTPATVCLAIPLYDQISLLKEHFAAVMAGIVAGVIASLSSVLALSVLFGLSHQEYVTLLPKSITTAIGMSVSEELGGLTTITVAVIIITGLLGNIFAEMICKWFRITHPIAKGIAIGSASHAVGTAKAIELGEVEGAMSSLSIAVSGLCTVIGASVFSNFL